MSLENVLKEIQRLKPFAEENVESGPPETLSGRRGRKHQAIESLTRLKREYRQDLLRSAVFIVVSGNQRSEFETIATGDKYKLFSADPEQFYNDLAKRIPPVLYEGKESVSNMFDILGRHLEDKMNELDAIGYNQLIFKAKYFKTVRNVSEFTSLVKEAINEQLGSEIVGIQAIASILDNAIATGHNAKTTSIVLNTGDEKLATDLIKDLERLTSRVFLVLAGKSSKGLKAEENISLKDVSEETVKQTLDTIKSSLKK